MLGPILDIFNFALVERELWLLFIKNFPVAGCSRGSYFVIQLASKELYLLW